MTQKPLLVWTNEPGDEPKKSVVSSAAGLGRITRVMNVFSGDVFWNNRHFLGSYHFDTSNNLGIDLSAPVSPITLDEYQSRQSFVSAVFTHSSERSRTYKLSSGHGSLLGARCAVVEAFRKQSATIVAGRGWPPGVSIEDSGYRGNEDADLPWWTRKLEILKKAKINIAIENTAAPWYCTEKIWHSIVSKALPVYRSEGTRIYETFPRESFIDTSDYECDGSMVDAVVALADDEVVTRINTCIDVYNREREKRISEIPHSYGDCISRVLERIRTIVPTSI
ncbi:MAG: glycosyltransferase family 10 [Pseudomonadota bacterium]